MVGTALAQREHTSAVGQHYGQRDVVSWLTTHLMSNNESLSCLHDVHGDRTSQDDSCGKVGNCQ